MKHEQYICKWQTKRRARAQTSKWLAQGANIVISGKCWTLGSRLGWVCTAKHSLKAKPLTRLSKHSLRGKFPAVVKLTEAGSSLKCGSRPEAESESLTDYIQNTSCTDWVNFHPQPTLCIWGLVLPWLGVPWKRWAQGGDSSAMGHKGVSAQKCVEQMPADGMWIHFRLDGSM